MKSFKEMMQEDVVAGDSGGNSDKIASGETSGAVTSKGPSTLKKKKKGTNNA